MKKQAIAKGMQLFFLCLYMVVLIGTTAHAAINDYASLEITLLNQDPDPVEPGEYVELRFKVVKTGNSELTDIEFELETEYPFTIDASDSAVKNIGDWVGNSEDNEYYTLYYKLRVADDAIADEYELTLYQTSKENSARLEYDFDIRVEEEKKPSITLGKIETSPRKVVANYDEARYDVEIVNNGEEQAQNVLVELEYPNVFDESYGYSATVNVGTIDAGATKTATFYLDTKEGAQAQTYPGVVTVSYTEENDNNNKETQTVMLPVNLRIFSKPEYSIENVELPEDIQPGDSVSAIITVKNIGSQKSESTSLQIFKDSTQPVEFDDMTDYIGEIGINETAQAVLTFTVDDDAVAKSYNFDVQVRSIQDNEVLVEEMSIPIVISPSTKGFGMIIVLVVLALAAIGFAFYLGRTYRP